MTSVYELTTPFGALRKQRFWDYFDGDALGSRWTESDFSGSGSFGMTDLVNEGYRITTALVSNASSGINFNNIHQYDFQASAYIAEWRAVEGDQILVFSGLMDSQSSTGTDAIVTRLDVGETDYYLRSADATTPSNSATTISNDTNWHTHNFTINSTVARYWIDGNLEVAKTTNLPTVKLQPSFNSFSRTSPTTATKARIRYMECYNT